MTNLAAGLPAQRFDLAGGVGREIVVVHVALGVDGGEGVEFLGFLGGAEGGQGQHLGLAAGEQAGAVGARADAHFAPDRADLGQGAAIGALARPGCGCANDLFVDFVEGALRRFARGFHLRRPFRPPVRSSSSSMAA